MRVFSCLVIAVAVFHGAVAAQEVGTLRGTVTDGSGRVLPGAVVRIGTTRLGAVVDSAGHFRVRNIPAGSYIVRVSDFGFAADSSAVDIAAGASATYSAQLRPSVQVLGAIVVTGRRLGESQVGALAQRASAPNIINVLAGDVIRELPNLNAAEAAGRIPGVTTERDEGEGKYVQVRGTEPRLTNVTINGAHIPGTQAGSRIPKLDDIPSDVLAAIEVTKTLTAEQDADAIGGSVNLVTKTPEGLPHGYIAGQFGQMTLLTRNQYQGGFAFGGRFGDEGKLGVLIGGSADRNNRAISDLEPAWNVDANGRSFPVEWSQRDYVYRRNRYGLGGDVDYRFTGGSSLYLKGLYSYFENFGTTYVNDVATNATGSAFGSTGDSAAVGSTGFGTGAEVIRESYNRTPRETMYAITAGGSTNFGALSLKFSANFAGTKQHERDYRFSPFVYDGPNGQGLTVAYDASNPKTPTFHYANAAMATAANTPANFLLGSYFTNDGNTNGYDDGGALNFSLPWQMGSSAVSNTFRFGAKLRDERKDFTSNRAFFMTNSPFALSQVPAGVTDPDYYRMVSPAFELGYVPDERAAASFEDAHGFVDRSNKARNALATFSGSEKVYSAYASNTLSAGAAKIYFGLRVENTHSDYTGHAVKKDKTGAVSGIQTVPGSQTYTDVFPSVQLDYDLGEGTDARVAVTRGIARPDYSQLAPSLSGTTDVGSRNNPSALTAGNPDLKPQHAWNYDFLVEHFFPSVGVISGGVFYKQINDFILSRKFTYNGPVTELVGFQGTHPENGGSGHLLGFEGEWQQRLVFLPGYARGLGFDVNYTHVSSKVVVDADGRTAPLARQSPNLVNVALTYDLGPISARGAWSYQGENITSYGDGLADALGDTYFYAHSQIDASVLYTVNSRLQLQFQGLNLNNAIFGFFQGAPGHDYSIQREYYGRTLYVGAKISN